MTTPLSTIRKESKEEFEKKFIGISVLKVSTVDSRDKQYYVGDVQSFNASAETRLLEAVKKWGEKKKMTMRAANKTGSDAGAGYTIGWNALISDLLSFIEEGLLENK